MTKQAVASDLVALVNRMADASGEVIRKYFRAKFDVETKNDQSPVTIADREAEQAIRRILEKERPGNGIWGEEFGKDGFDSEFLWVIDPIDGTKSFTTGRATFGTLIGLFHNGEAVLGIIDQPILKERWIGVKGKGTTFNGTPVRCRPCAALKNAAIATTGPNYFETPESLAKFNRVSDASSFTLYGGDCYMGGQLASGFLDGFVEGRMHLHDYAALIPVIEGAGGLITDWQGKPLGLQAKNALVASGDARLHEELCGMLGR